MFQSDLFPAGEQQSSVPWAYAVGTRIAGLLASGRRLTRADISGLFAEETGALDWGSAWTIDDYNNAVEIGALLWLRESSRIDLATNVHEAEARFDWLEAALPPRHVRSEAQVELQQFSTRRCWLGRWLRPQLSLRKTHSSNHQPAMVRLRSGAASRTPRCSSTRSIRHDEARWATSSLLPPSLRMTGN